MDVKQSTRLFGHLCSLCEQRRRTWYVFISCLNLTTHLRPAIEELLIDFQKLIGEHSGENMAEAVWATMELYNLVGKVSFQGLSLPTPLSNVFPDHCNCDGQRQQQQHANGVA
jgi:hypothetical protein